MSEADDSVNLDDWGAAMAEQAAHDAAEHDAAEQSASTQDTSQKADIFQDFSAKASPTGIHNDIEFILDIPVLLTVELGRTKISIKNLLQLAQGSVVELAGMAGEPMDILINGYLIAQGEVVVVNDKFGIRVTDIISPADRIRKLNK